MTGYTYKAIQQIRWDQSHQESASLLSLFVVT